MDGERIVLGYDAREEWCPRERLWPPERIRGFLLRTDVTKPLSTDTIVWPSVFQDEQLRLLELDDLGLGPAGIPVPRMHGWVQDLWQSLNDLRSALPPARRSACAVIAVTADSWHFDVPPSAPSQLDAHWTFLGYDVVDGWLLSGLSNCGYTEGEVGALRARWGPRLNEHHLFVDAADAAAFARMSDGRVREHAPFYRCGIWRSTGPGDQP